MRIAKWSCSAGTAARKGDKVSVSNILNSLCVCVCVCVLERRGVIKWIVVMEHGVSVCTTVLLLM